MKQKLYLECYAGISGDMTVAALLDLGADADKLKRTLDSLKLEGYTIRISRVKKSGLDACDFAVNLDAEHEKFHALPTWEDFIADPGKYLNGMIIGWEC